MARYDRMNGSGPIPRKTPLKRSAMKSAATAAGFEAKPRKRINQVSAKRRKLAPTRAAVVAEVLARDGQCRGRGLTPVWCTIRSTDCHELYRGANRQTAWLNPDLCVGLCRTCHDWVTTNPEKARPLGLALRTGDEPRGSDENYHNQPEQGKQVLAPANTPPTHDPRGGTVEWMCKAIHMPDGRRFYSAKMMLDDGITIPDDVLADASETDDAVTLFPYESCFCVVDAGVILEGLGLTFTIDELGDHVVRA